MYDFIYIVLFYAARRNNSISYSKFWASGCVALLIEIHVGLVVSLLRYVIDLPVADPNVPYFVRKWSLAPYILPFLVVLYLFYRWRHDKLMEKYKDKKMLTTKNVVIVIALYIISFIFSVIAMECRHA